MSSRPIHQFFESKRLCAIAAPFFSVAQVMIAPEEVDYDAPAAEALEAPESGAGASATPALLPFRAFGA